MSDVAALKRALKGRFFAGWDEFVDRERIEASEANIRRLVNDLIALGEEPTEKAARRAVDACVRRFNDIDDGWICTIEREDIYEEVGKLVELCGFECGEDWLHERDW